jgi:hypothetical protein
MPVYGRIADRSCIGRSKKFLLSTAFKPINENWQIGNLTPEIYEIACGSFKHKKPPEIKGTGYVVKSLEAALWSFYHSETFKEGCLLAVNLGDDADTTGAIYGQIAGAYYGIQGIPEKWVKKISRRQLRLI